ncbi:MAG: metalloregulator ArsR/SmtB family transcription factor [Marinobacter sp.]
MNTQAIDLQLLEQAAAQASSFLRSLANQDRLLLLCQLSQGELSVAELADATGIKQPSLSQQLGVLRRQRLIAPRKDGKSVFYQISEPNVLVILQQLYDMFCPEGEHRK